MPFYIPFIQAPCKFVNVPLQMLLAGVMVNPMESPLQNGKNAFNAIDRCPVAGVLRVLVINGAVAIIPFDSLVARELIGVNCRAEFSVVADGACKGKSAHGFW